MKNRFQIASSFKKFTFLFLISSALYTNSVSAAAPAEPKPVGEKSITSTIVITKSGTYDFGKVLHIWKGTNWSCTGDKENGPQILRIEANDVTVKNFYFVGDGKTKGSKGLGDPIHITSCGKGMGNTCPSGGPKRVTLDGISGHACEDLITIGTPGIDDITIKNSYFKANSKRSSWDKTLQNDFGTRVKILNNTFNGGKMCVRFKPNTDGEVIGNFFYDCEVAIRATSDDAGSVDNMKNGPVKLKVRDNKYEKVGSQMKNSGSQVYIEN